MKEVIDRWEERDNEEKEEVLRFRKKEGNDVNVLGAYMEDEVDVIMWMIGLRTWEVMEE